MAGQNPGKTTLMARLSWLSVLRIHTHTSITSAFHAKKWQLTILKKNFCMHNRSGTTWDVLLHMGQAT